MLPVIAEVLVSEAFKKIVLDFLRAHAAKSETKLDDSAVTALDEIWTAAAPFLGRL